MAKSGRLSKDDQLYILSNAGRMTPEKIAKNLNRGVEKVAEFIRKNYKPKTAQAPTEDVEDFIIKQELMNSQEWKILEKEFTEQELVLFREKYIKLMTQFRGDILSTEETQIFQSIKFDILMHRNLAARQRSLQDISRLEEAQDKFLSSFNNDPSAMAAEDRAFAEQLQTQLDASRQAEQFRTTEYVKLHERHAKLMNDLKGTRDQRVKDIESGKQSMLGLIKILQQKDMQESVGRESELAHIAGEQEYNRLGQLYEYEDGTIDRPILSADTVDLTGEPNESE